MNFRDGISESLTRAIVVALSVPVLMLIGYTAEGSLAICCVGFVISPLISSMFFRNKAAGPLATVLLLTFTAPALADIPVDLLVILEQTRPIEPPPVVAPPAPVVIPLIEPPVTARLSYPLRGNWWSGCSGWQHMIQGEHAALQLDPAWLKPMPWDQLQSLHADAHEQKIRWQYVQRLDAKRPGGFYRWRGDGRSCGWVWVPSK